MYDVIIDLISTVWRHGFSVTALGTAVFVLLKQRKVKKKLKSYIPWLLDDDSEVKGYVQNQIVIMENQRRMMERIGVEWYAPTLNGSSQDSAKKKLKLSLWHSITSLLARSVKQFMIFGGKKMKNYLRKLGSRKFQALLTSLVINAVSAYLFIKGTFEIDSAINSWMPVINMTVGTISTWVYILVEGSVDKSQQGGKSNELDYTQDTSA